MIFWIYLQFCLPVADDLKICRTIKNVFDFRLLQSDTECIRKCGSGM